MSQNRDVRLFDVLVILGFVGVVGYFAQRSHAPKTASTPGVVWTSAPAPAPKLLEEATVLMDAEPLAPEESMAEPSSDPTVVDKPSEEGNWE